MEIFFKMTTARKLDIILENHPEARNLPKSSIFVEFWHPAGGLFWPALISRPLLLLPPRGLGVPIDATPPCNPPGGYLGLNMRPEQVKDEPVCPLKSNLPLPPSTAVWPNEAIVRLVGGSF